MTEEKQPNKNELIGKAIQLGNLLYETDQNIKNLQRRYGQIQQERAKLEEELKALEQDETYSEEVKEDKEEN